MKTPDEGACDICGGPVMATKRIAEDGILYCEACERKLRPPEKPAEVPPEATAPAEGSLSLIKPRTYWACPKCGKPSTHFSVYFPDDVIEVIFLACRHCKILWTRFICREFHGEFEEKEYPKEGIGGEA